MKRIITTFFVFVLIIGIFAPIAFSLTPKGVEAGPAIASAANTHATTTEEKNIKSAMGDCGIGFIGGGSIDVCVEYIFYYVFYVPTGYILTLSAKFLDFTANLTLSSRMYRSAGFLQTGWTLIRDISNVFFILILLYIALCIILDIKVAGGVVSGGDPKTLIWWVVLIAMLINFSMFFTDFIIDTSNTLALVFYNQISVVAATSSTDKPEITDAEGVVLAGKANTGVDPKSIALSLAQGMHPQILMDQNFWNSLKADGVNVQNTEWLATFLVNTNPILAVGHRLWTGQWKVTNDIVRVPTGKMIMILLILSAIYFSLAWSFWIASFAFMGRMLELFIAIIFSPFAFVSFIVPSMRKMKRFGWKDWFDKLNGAAFSAPIYFLMILLLSMIMGSALFGGTQIDVNSSWTITLLGSVLLPTVICYQLLQMATKQVQENSGEMGQMLSRGAERLTKGAGALALGGVATVATGGLAGGAGVAGMAGRMVGNNLAKSAATNLFGNGTIGKLANGAMKNKFNNGDWTKTKPDVKPSTPSGGSKAGGAATKVGGMALQATGSVIKGTGSAVKTVGDTVGKLGMVGALVGGAMSTAGSALKGVGGGIKNTGKAMRNIGKPTLNKDELKQVRTEKTKRGNAISKQKEKIDGKKKDLKNVENDVGGEKKKLKENNAKQKETEDSIKKDFNEGNHMMALGKESGNTEMFKKGQDLVKSAQKKENEYNKPFGAKESFENQRKFSEGKIKEGEAQIKQKKSELRDDNAVLKGLESGKKAKVDADGKVQRNSLGFAKTEPKLVYGNDPKTGKPNINPATGNPVTKTEALQTLSVKELASASKNSASSPVRERLGQKVAESSGKTVSMKRDPLGSVKTVSSTSKPAVRSWSDDYAKSSQGAFAGNMTSTAGGNIPEIKVTVISPNAQPSAPAPAVNVITKNLNDSSSGKSKGGSGNSGSDSRPAKSSATMKNVNKTTVKEKSSTVVSGGGNASANIAVAFSQVVGDIKAAGNVSSGGSNYSTPSVSSGGSGSGNTKGGGEEYYSEPAAKSSPASSPASAPQKGK